MDRGEFNVQAVQPEKSTERREKGAQAAQHVSSLQPAVAAKQGSLMGLTILDLGSALALANGCVMSYFSVAGPADRETIGGVGIARGGGLSTVPPRSPNTNEEALRLA